MKCPFCGTNTDKVIDSRESVNGRVIRRRRKCLACGRKYTTKETLVNLPIVVLKQNRNREPFYRDKLRRGIKIASNKRPISPDQIDYMLGEIEGEIQDLKSRDVDSHKIGEIVMNHLKEIDDVAYVRFASVYRKFKDKEQFYKEIEQLKKLNKK
jgi:transcriptional repressor NrdR